MTPEIKLEPCASDVAEAEPFLDVPGAFFAGAHVWVAILSPKL
jgi:hypothetical protein